MSNTFRADLSRIEERLHGKLERICRESANAVYNEMSSGGKFSPGTPIDTGAHRQHWDAGVGDLPAGGDAGGAADARVVAAISAFQPGETLFVTNNGPAIRRLEFGFIGTDALGRYYIGFGPKSVNGRSSQAPDGFVRPAAEAFPQIVAEVVASQQA